MNAIAKYIIIGLMLSAMFIQVAVAETSESSKPLYRISISSYADARLVNSSGVSVILTEGNEYLISGDAATIERIRAAGIEIELMHHEFNPDDWVIVTSENPDVELAVRSHSLGMADRVLFGSYVLVRNADAAGIGFRDDLWTLSLPSGSAPVRYYSGVHLDVAYPNLDLIDSIVGLISKDSVEAYVRRLENFQTRYSYSDSINSARDWLAEKFSSFGLEVTIDSFLHNRTNVPYGDYGYNVVADHVGTSAPDLYIILGAHYDCTSNDPYVFAPGADDNASGTAFCVEIARVIQQFDTPRTLRFICFSFEEQGLIGSRAYVDSNLGQNIEVMINADMIGNNIPGNTTVKIFNTQASMPYAEVISNEMSTYASLFGDVNVGNSGRSDHAPFQQYHPALFIHEQNFSTNYHSTSDIADNLDFDYMTSIVKASAAATYRIAISPPNVENIVVTDPGKGDRLLVEWDEPEDSRDFEYKVFVGTTPGHYTDYFVVQKDVSSTEVTGLTDGTEYFISVLAVIGDTLFSIVHSEDSGIPYSVPFAPNSLTIAPEYKSIQLDWPPSSHTDVTSYRVFRSEADLDEFLQIADIADTAWTDELVLQENYYDYYVVAVDEDSIQSAATEIVTSRGMFFNRNLLVVLETAWMFDPSVVIPRYRSMLADIPHDELIVPSEQAFDFQVEDIGQYRSVFWIADGKITEAPVLFDLSQYKEKGGNILLVGPSLAGKLGGFIGLLGHSRSYEYNFASAYGIEGWPDAILDHSLSSYWNDDGNSEYLFEMSVLEYDPEIAIPIYLYQAADTDSTIHNKPCGIYAEIGESRLAYLNFPLAHLDIDSGNRILNHAADMLGITRNGAGDLDNDTHYTLIDAVLMIGMLYSSMPLLDDMNLLDVNADCNFDLLDVVHLLGYIYLDGDAPGYGCVESD